MDQHVVVDGIVESEDPFRTPRTDTAFVDPTEEPPMPLRLLLYVAEIVLGYGTLIVFHFIAPFWMNEALHGMGLFQFFVDPYIEASIGIVVVHASCFLVVGMLSSGPFRMCCFACRCLYSVLHTGCSSLLILGSLIFSFDSPWIPLGVWTWSFLIGILLLTSCIVQYRAGISPDSVGPDEAMIGWDT